MSFIRLGKPNTSRPSCKKAILTVYRLDAYPLENVWIFG